MAQRSKGVSALKITLCGLIASLSPNVNFEKLSNKDLTSLYLMQVTGEATADEINEVFA